MRGLRRGSSARRLDPTPMRELLADDRMWTVRGVVYVPEDGGSHFQIVRGSGGAIKEVLVEVLSAPGKIDLTCRLAAGDGAGGGLWRIPGVGTQVVVDIPDGDVEFYPTIVGILGTVPERVSEERTILVASGTVEITAPKVVLGPSPATVISRMDGFVHGQGTDMATGLKFWMLGSTSSKVVGNK